MHLTLREILLSVTILALLCALGWAVWLIFKRETHTRERFAFAALAVLATMFQTVASALTSKESIWSSIERLGRSVAGLPEVRPDPPRMVDHLLIIILAVILARYIFRIYSTWRGAVSLRQVEKELRHEQQSLVGDGLWEARRIIKREPPAALYGGRQGRTPEPPEVPRESLAWHIQARDLLCLRHPSYEMNDQDCWHEDERCWIGTARRTRQLIALLCSPTAASPDLGRFVKYVDRIAQQRAVTQEEVVLLHAVPEGLPQENVVEGQSVEQITEDNLLDGLVDFSDYYSYLRRRVKRDTLADSDLTLEQTYVASSFQKTGGHR